MNEDILQRAMFAMPLSPEAQNSGIMSGFMDEPMSPEDAGLEEMPVMARTPQNPEILMNNLRGDMRSLDARYVELAQMVGEQAAMDTPPEVLAMLMGQMGAQEGGGIGALPQGQEMMPPGMEGMDPGMQMMDPGMQQGMAEQQMMDPNMQQMMDPGMQQMPPGMGDMGPFPLGGAEQAPPQNFAVGGLAVPIARGLLAGGERLRGGAQALNQALGARFMTPQFSTQTMRGPGGERLVMQGRETLRQLPSGQIAQGAGTRLTPATTLGPMQSPTLTQGLRQGLNTPVGQLGTSLAGGTAASTAMINMFGSDQQPLTEEEKALLMQEGSGLADRIPPPESLMPAVSTEPARAPQEPIAAPTVADTITDRVADETPAADDTASFIARVAEQAKERTKGDRVRERFDELSPLYKEILGDDAGARKQQALLLLAEAGFRFAGTAKPTMGMALADAVSGVPAGMSALAAQKAEREAKLKSTALAQSIEDIGAEDAAQRALQLKMLDVDGKILLEQAKNRGNKILNEGFGLRTETTKDGSFIGQYLDENDPAVVRMRTSRFALQEDNPFVTVGGMAPESLITDKAAREKAAARARAYEEAIGLVENIKEGLPGVYGPGAFISNFSNNVIVPISPLTPDLKNAAAIKKVEQAFNKLMVLGATADAEGRPSVFLQQAVKETFPKRPGTFFQDPEVNLTRLNSLQTMFMNGLHSTGAQLGVFPQEMTLNTPPTGTKSAPFVMSNDPEQNERMNNFLINTYSKATDPRTMIYLQAPDGSVASYPAIQHINSLRGR